MCGCRSIEFVRSGAEKAEKQCCCGSVSFWYESRSADPCLWLMDLDSAPDPTIFIIDLHNLNVRSSIISQKVGLPFLFNFMLDPDPKPVPGPFPKTGQWSSLSKHWKKGKLGRTQPAFLLHEPPYLLIYTEESDDAGCDVGSVPSRRLIVSGSRSIGGGRRANGGGGRADGGGIRSDGGERRPRTLLRSLLASNMRRLWRKKSVLLMASTCSASLALLLKTRSSVCRSMTFWCVDPRIRGSMPVTNGSGSGLGSYYLRHWPVRGQQKTK